MKECSHPYPSRTTGPLNSGDISINAGDLTIENGATISTFTFANSSLFKAGNSGRIDVTANSIQLIGESPINLTRSSISAATFGDGSGGEVLLTSKDISVLDGAEISSVTLAAGRSGGVQIVADDVFLSGVGSITGNPSQITSAALFLTPDIRQFLNLPENLSGDAGGVTLKANNLRITNRATFSGSNQGSGGGGNLFLDVDSLLIDNGGAVTAGALSGDGGDISTRSNILSLDNGMITASTQGLVGTGGNISIVSDLIVAKNNSLISANSEQSIGGRINIDTLGYFPDSSVKISATSSLGPQFDGSVSINQPYALTQASDLPNDIIQAPKVALLCSGDPETRSRATYYRVGRDGTPDNPDDFIESLPNVSSQELQAQKLAQLAPSTVNSDTGERILLIEPQGIVDNGDGTSSFVAVVNDPDSNKPIMISSKCLRPS